MLGSYLLLDRVGKGGVGQVFKAKHRYMNRVVAIKTLHPDSFRDKEALQRFRREIEVASQLNHPNIVHAYEAGMMGSVLALVLEFVEGTNLGQMVEKSGPLPVGVACEYVRQAAAGLQYAHERGFVHRDIKPLNLLVTRAGPKTTLECVKILDLGLARASEPVEGSQTNQLTVIGSGDVMQGTPDYMAPEQAMDFHSADIRSDIYSLGCTLFYLLAGNPPFPAGTLAEKLLRHQQSEVPIDGLRPDLPEGLADVVRKMMAKNAEDRYQAPEEVEEALAPFCQHGSHAGKHTIHVQQPATLNASTGESHSTMKMPKATEPDISPRKKGEEAAEEGKGSSSLMKILLVTVLLAALGGGGAYFFLNQGTSPDTGTQAKATPTADTKVRLRVVDYSRGFRPEEMQVNGNALVQQNDGILRLTFAVANQRSSAFRLNQVAVDAFATEFTFKIKGEADGFTFTLQNQGVTALGEASFGLGYKGIPKSVGVKFDLWGTPGEDNSVGFYSKGAAPDKPFLKLGGGVNLKSGNVMKARLEYNGKQLKLTVTDTVTGASHSESTDIDIPALLQGPKAFVGFTGTTGGRFALQEVLTWIYETG